MGSNLSRFFEKFIETEGVDIFCVVKTPTLLKPLRQPIAKSPRLKYDPRVITIIITDFPRSF